MTRRLSDYSTFFREFRQTFDTTGAVAPSGRFLAKAIIRPLLNHERPVRILEVGAGTGAVTQELVRHVAPDDQLHIVEINDRFVQVLRRRFQTESRFQQVAERTQIFHTAVQDLSADQPYHHIICGVPFNNFSSELVESIFRRMLDLLHPEGTLSFFEYLWIRHLKMLVASRDERRRVARVGSILKCYINRYERGRNNVLWNVPPAVTHHLRTRTNGQDGNGS
jgi:phospholipid N-methyltransferase